MEKCYSSQFTTKLQQQEDGTKMNGVQLVDKIIPIHSVMLQILNRWK